MDIKVLEEFCALAETGSFSKAADKLSSTQPVLTRHIQKLEQELGYPLFERTTRRVSLNEAGSLFFPYAQQMIDTYQNYSQAVRLSTEGESNTLRIGMTETFSSSSIHDAIFRFASASGISPEFSAGTVENLKGQLSHGKLDIVIAYEKVENSHDEFSRLAYFCDELAAVLPSNHSLATESSISLKELSGDGFILLRNENVVGRLALECCEQAGFKPRIIHASKYEDNILEMVRKDVGVSILLKSPRTAIGAVILDMEPTVQVDLNLIYLDEKLSAAGKNFIEFIRQHKPISAKR